MIQAGSEAPQRLYHPQTLYQNMQALFSALAEAEERQPYLQDSAVRRGTRGLARGVPPGRAARPGTGVCRAGLEACLSRLQTPVSLLLLLLLLSRSFLVITSPPKVGNSMEALFSSVPELQSSPMKTALCGTRWDQPLLPPSGQVLGAGPRGLLGGGHVRGFWPIGPPSLCSPCAPWTVMTSGPSPH